MKKVLICLPTHSTIESSTIKSLWDMEVPHDVKLDLEISKGYVVTTARNILVDVAIKNNYDYTLWIDSDVIVPSHLLTHLYDIIESGKADMATGYYVKKVEGTAITEIYGDVEGAEGQMANVLEQNLPKTMGVYPCKGAGFGCILIKTDVFKKILEAKPDNLIFEYIRTKTAICSEDIFFLKNAAELGFKLVVDTSCRCGHIGQKIY